MLNTYPQVRKLQKTEAHYLAGLLESSGSFSILSKKSNPRPLISFSSKDLNLAIFLSKLIYGTSDFVLKTRDRAGTRFRIIISGKQNVKQFLEQILPYLKTASKIERAHQLLLLCAQSKRKLVRRPKRQLERTIAALQRKLELLEQKLATLSRESIPNLSQEDKRILELLAEFGSLSASELAAELGISRSNASLKLNRLHAIGFLQKLKERKRILFKLV